MGVHDFSALRLRPLRLRSISTQALAVVQSLPLLSSLFHNLPFRLELGVLAAAAWRRRVSPHQDARVTGWRSRRGTDAHRFRGTKPSKESLDGLAPSGHGRIASLNRRGAKDGSAHGRRGMDVSS